MKLPEAEFKALERLAQARGVSINHAIRRR